jgi:flavin-dependent dehydrogenase
MFLRYKANQSPFVPDVLLVGAGPVGLWTALQLKAKNPELKVLLLEKHLSYTRTQYLRLDFSLVSDNPLVKAALEKLIQQGEAKLDREGALSISIQFLEKCLQECASALGIKIKHQAVSDGETLKEEYPETRFIIGADGYRSTIRKTVFGVDEAELPKQDLQHMIELKYQAEGEVEKVNGLKYYAVQPHLKGFIADKEHIKYDAEKNTSEVTQRFLVDKETYHDKRLATAKASDPLQLTQNIPDYLRTAISVWLNARSDVILVPNKNPRVHSNRIKVAEGVLGPRLNKTILHIYKNEKSYHIEVDENGRERAWFLGGDALIGLSFMKGLNAGMESGTKLAELLTTQFKSGPAPHLEELGAAYQSFNNDLYERKKNEVQVINQSINHKRNLIQAVRILTHPFKLSLEDIELVVTEHPLFGRTKRKWPWVIGGALLFSAIAVASILTWGLSLAVTISVLTGAPLLGALVGHRVWKLRGPYETVEDAQSKAEAALKPSTDSRQKAPIEIEMQELGSDARQRNRLLSTPLNRQSPGYPGQFRQPSLVSNEPRPSVPVRCKPG